MIVGNICFGMNSDEWAVQKIVWKPNKSNVIYDATKQDDNILKFFYKKREDKDICSAQLHVKGEDPVKLKLSQAADIAKSIKQHSYYGYGGLLCLTLSRGTDKKKVLVKDVKEFYWPKEYCDALKAEIVAGSDFVKFKLDRNQQGDLEQILYKPEHVKQIREELPKNNKFIVKFKEQGKEDRVVKVEDYTSGSYLWWDGWTPMTMWKILNYGWVGMPYSPKPTTTPAVIEIDLDEDKKAEPQYRFNRNVTYAAILAMGAGMIYLFRDNIRNIFSGLFGSPQLPRVFARDHHNDHTNYNVMPK